LEAQDAQFDEETVKYPYQIKTWLRYINYLKNLNNEKRFEVYEKAVKHLPRSYKLWNAYLIDKTEWLYESVTSPDDDLYKELIHTFERALVHMNKMPLIW
jgi:pre-mRNA-splicing factor SYF1